MWLFVEFLAFVVLPKMARIWTGPFLKIKTITRIYNNYTKDFEYKITEFFVVSEPPEGAIEMSRFHLNQLMRIKENPPNRYGNK